MRSTAKILFGNVALIMASYLAFVPAYGQKIIGAQDIAVQKVIMSKSITQFSTVNALMSGLYDGVVPVAQVVEKGDFGIGCSHALRGEVTILDGKVLEAKGDGSIKVMQADDQLPFAQVTYFTPEASFEVSNISKDNLGDFLSQKLSFHNVFLAIKIKGTFAKLKIRRPHEQSKPYKSVLDVVSQQAIDEMQNVKGTMIGYWSPNFFDKISVAQFHVHFISDDETKGGHVMDFELAKGTLQYQRKMTFTIELPDDAAYLGQNLDIDGMEQLIKHVEN